MNTYLHIDLYCFSSNHSSTLVSYRNDTHQDDCLRAGVFALGSGEELVTLLDETVMPIKQVNQVSNGFNYFLYVPFDPTPESTCPEAFFQFTGIIVV